MHVMLVHHARAFHCRVASNVKRSFSEKRQNIAMSTGFAFLFRARLVIATCTAYWQVFWHTALRKTLTVSSVDALTGVLRSLVEFTHARTFFFNPGLTAMALLVWLVPLASLLPPPTLSVLPTTVVSSRLERVAVPYFDNVEMAGTSIGCFLVLWPWA